MKIIDVLFILIATGLLVLLNEFDYGHLVSRFSVIVFVIGYFSGKAISRKQQKQTS